MAEQEHSPSLAEQIAAMGARVSYQKLRAEIASRDPTDRSAQGKSDALAMDQAIRASLERLEKLEATVEAARRHVRSYEAGTLIGSELNLAHHLRDLDGEIWAPWCLPGEVVMMTDAELRLEKLEAVAKWAARYVEASNAREEAAIRGGLFAEMRAALAALDKPETQP